MGYGTTRKSTPKPPKEITVADAPPGMSKKQKEKWVEQQKAIQADREYQQKLKNDPDFKKAEQDKQYQERLENRGPTKYADVQRGANGGRPSGPAPRESFKQGEWTCGPGGCLSPKNE